MKKPKRQQLRPPEILVSAEQTGRSAHPNYLISHHAEQSRQHGPKIRCLSYALCMENRFSTPSILDKGICGNVMAT